MLIFNDLPLDHLVARVPLGQRKEHKARHYYEIDSVLYFLKSIEMKVFDETGIIYDPCSLLLFHLELGLRAIEANISTPCIEELFVHNKESLFCL